MSNQNFEKVGGEGHHGSSQNYCSVLHVTVLLHLTIQSQKVTVLYSINTTEDGNSPVDHCVVIAAGTINTALQYHTVLYYQASVTHKINMCLPSARILHILVFG